MPDASLGSAIESRFMTTSSLPQPQLRTSADDALQTRHQRQLAAPQQRRWHWSWKQVWFQLHWFIGITAGTVLVIIGLSGATLAFKDELLDVMNPGVRHVPVETRAPLTPAQLSNIAAAEHRQRVASITLYAQAGVAGGLRRRRRRWRATGAGRRWSWRLSIAPPCRASGMAGRRRLT